ncbi:MAG: hypothetical protein LBV41_12125 [Cytophagaceae bacterium]|jgi:hypothetical protein|nr:hypothetical protein [Cytophagaceae bacterium]
MDLGDIAYGLIMLVAVVASIYKKAIKNNRPHDDMPMPEQEIDDTLKEFFPTVRQLIEVENRKIASPPAYRKPENVSQFSDYRKNDFKRQRIKEKETISSSLRKRIPQKDLFDEDESKTATIWDKDPFNLQKAIIYSEILKRPDY